MIPIRPTIHMADGTHVTIAEHQPEYSALPAVVAPDGMTVTEWEFTAEELDHIFQRGGKLRVFTLTFGQPFQPVALEVVPGDAR